MTQDKRLDERNKPQGKNKAEDKSPTKEKRESPPTKVIIRRLPPTLTEETFLEQISPVPENDYFYFCKGDRDLGPNAFSRAYINFKKQEDIYTFRETFDDYVFVDGKGNEYAAIVEFAPFQKVPKKKEKKDNRKGTIEEDPDYKSFLEKLKNPDTDVACAPEKYLEEIEQREKELKANKGVLKMSTPLLEYIKKRKEEKRAALQRAKDERKRRDFEKKKAKEDERRKKREDERKRQQQKEKERKEKDKDKSSENKEDPQIKLLKNPEREKESKERTKDKSNTRNYGKEKSPTKDGSTKYGKDRDRQRDRDKGGNRDDRKESERVPSYARKDDKGESGRQNDKGRDAPRDRGKDRERDRGRGDGGSGRDREREREKERERNRERERNNDKNREKEKREQANRDKGKDQTKDSGSKPQDQLPQGRFAKNKDGTRGSPKDQEDSKGSSQSEKKETGNEAGKDKKSPVKEGEKGKKEYKLRFSKEERKKRTTPEEKGDKNSADSDKEEGLAGVDAESVKARERRKMRYKDRPERAIYQPGQRAAQRRRELEKKSPSQDGKGDEKNEGPSDKE